MKIEKYNICVNIDWGFLIPQSFFVQKNEEISNNDNESKNSPIEFTIESALS